MSNLIKRKAPEVIIKRPDGTEERIVKGANRESSQAAKTVTTATDEDTRVVNECAPYTASFNNLLMEVRPHENPMRLVQLVHERMQADGIPLNTTTYNLLMKRLIPFKDNAIFELYDELKNEGMKKSSSVRPDIETYRILFRSCERNAEYSRTFLLYEQMKDIFGIVPDTSMFNALLGYCAAVKDVAQATYFIEEMKDSDVERDANTYNCFMSVLVESAPYDETLKVFHEMMESPDVHPTLRTYNTILKAARVNDDYDRAFQIFDELKKKGIVPDITTYNSLLWLCEKRLDFVFARGKYSALHRTEDQRQQGKAALIELVLVLVSEMKSMRVSLNTFAYNKILSVLFQCQDFRIFSTYDQMRALAFSTKEGGNTAVPKKANTEPSGMPDKLFSMKEPQQDCSIQEPSVYLNKETFMILLRASLEMGYPERCKELQKADMQQSGVVIDRDIAALLWQVCQETTDMEWAEEILERVVQTGVLLDTKLYNYYLAVLAAAKDPLVFSAFSEMKLGIHKYGSSPDTATYNVLIQAYINIEDFDNGMKLWETLNGVSTNTKPDTKSYCLFIELCEKKKETNAPSRLVEKLISERRVDNAAGDVHHSVAREVVHRLLRLYVALSDPRLEDFFKIMKEGRDEAYPRANVDTYGIAMRYYFAQGNEDMVQRLFNEMKTNNLLDTNLESYEVMLDMYHKRKDQVGLKRLFESALMTSIKFNVHMYNTLIEIAILCENEAFVFEILQDMKINEVPMAESTMAIFLSSSTGRKSLTEALKRNLIVKNTSTAAA